MYIYIYTLYIGEYEDVQCSSTTCVVACVFTPRFLHNKHIIYKYIFIYKYIYICLKTKKHTHM